MLAKINPLNLSPFKLAWVALVGNIIVILQGAFVRATGSGAGCGRHWPTCNGEVIPLNHTTESIIEFSHRMLSLAVLILGVLLLVQALRLGKKHAGFRTFAISSFFFLIIEALLGAGTVLFELTGDNASLARGVMVPVHLVNSLMLVGSLALTVFYAYFIKNTKQSAPWPLKPQQQPLLSTVLLVGLVGMLFLMFTGGVAALGNTLFPSESLQAGLAADFNANSHLFIRLRVLHPLIAISIGIYLFLSLGLSWWLKPINEAKRVAQMLLGVYLAQLVVGTLNLAFLAPIALQILHLFMATLAFALLAILSAYALGSEKTASLTSISARGQHLS